MADGVTVEVSTVAFEAALQRLRAGVRDGIVNPKYGTLPKQASLLAKRCQDFTPPRNVGQGRAAVARDLANIFRPLTASAFTSPRLRKIVRTDDSIAWNAAAKNFDTTNHLKNTKAINFSPAWHAQNRMSRGRGRRGRGSNIGVVTLGAQARLARSYITKIKKRVGWARAGWNAGIWAGGAGADSRAPAWVSKHGVGHGSFTFQPLGENAFVRVSNQTGWARYGSVGEGNRILNNAIRARARDMEAYALRMMRIAANKAASPAAAA